MNPKSLCTFLKKGTVHKRREILVSPKEGISVTLFGSVFSSLNLQFKLKFKKLISFLSDCDTVRCQFEQRYLVKNDLSCSKDWPDPKIHSTQYL